MSSAVSIGGAAGVGSDAQPCGSRDSQGSLTLPTSARKAKRKLMFTSDVLRGEKFYLYLKNTNIDVKALEEDINTLGGAVEKFLSRDISRVVVPNSKYIDNSDGSSGTKNGRKSSQGSPDVLNNCFANSRGRALLLRSNKNKSSPKQNDFSCDPVGFAKKWGIKIILLKELQGIISDEKYKLDSSVCSPVEPLKTRGRFSSRNKQVKPQELTGCFVKVEDESRMYRVIHDQFKVFPQMYIDEKGIQSPFERAGSRTKQVNPSPKSDEKCSNVQQKSNQNAKKKLKKTVVHVAQGYCECCDIMYKDLKSHCASDRHRMFAENKENYKKLDSTINSLPDFDSFFVELTGQEGNKQEEVNTSVQSPPRSPQVHKTSVNTSTVPSATTLPSIRGEESSPTPQQPEVAQSVAVPKLESCDDNKSPLHTTTLPNISNEPDSIKTQDYKPAEKNNNQQLPMEVSSDDDGIADDTEDKSQVGLIPERSPPCLQSDRAVSLNFDQGNQQNDCDSFFTPNFENLNFDSMFQGVSVLQDADDDKNNLLCTQLSTGLSSDSVDLLTPKKLIDLGPLDTPEKCAIYDGIPQQQFPRHVDDIDVKVIQNLFKNEEEIMDTKAQDGQVPSVTTQDNKESQLPSEPDLSLQNIAVKVKQESQNLDAKGLDCASLLQNAPDLLRFRDARPQNVLLTKSLSAMWDSDTNEDSDWNIDISKTCNNVLKILDEDEKKELPAPQITLNPVESPDSCGQTVESDETIVPSDSGLKSRDTNESSSSFCMPIVVTPEDNGSKSAVITSESDMEVSLPMVLTPSPRTNDATNATESLSNKDKIKICPANGDSEYFADRSEVEDLLSVGYHSESLSGSSSCQQSYISKGANPAMITRLPCPSFVKAPVSSSSSEDAGFSFIKSYNNYRKVNPLVDKSSLLSDVQTDDDNKENFSTDRRSQSSRIQGHENYSSLPDFQSDSESYSSDELRDVLTDLTQSSQRSFSQFSQDTWRVTPTSDLKVKFCRVPLTPSNDKKTKEESDWRVKRSGDCKLTFSSKSQKRAATFRSQTDGNPAKRKKLVY